MDTVLLREKLHNLIDNSSEEQLSEMYSFLKSEYTEEFKASLDYEFAEYFRTGQVVPKKEVDEMVASLL